jgi:hypothetical protein
LLFQTLLLVISVVAIAAAVIPWIAIPLVPLAIIFLVLRRYFLETSRDVKRLESTSEYPGSRVDVKCNQTFIYAIIKETPEILQNLSSRISHLINIR